MTRALLLALVLAALAGCSRAPGPPAVRAEDVTLPTAEGDARAVEYAPVGGPHPAVLVLHGDYGPEGVRRHAQKLADDGYLVLAIDLYDGDVAKDVEKAHILSRAIPDEKVKAYLKAAVDRLARRSDGRIGVIGWDTGGGYALDLAIDDPRVSACVTCYGRLRTEAGSLRPMKASVLGVFAENDAGNPQETRRDFQDAMKAAGKDLAGMLVLDGCGGGFMTPGPDREAGPNDARAAQDAWAAIDAFLRKRLRQ
jgi:carboxymethylenebutenolidase